MGGFVPAAALSALQMGMTAAQQERQADAAHDAAKADAQARIAQMRLVEAADDRARREKLRKALAGQKASFAAQGLGSGGSAGAVLAGLAKEATLGAAENQQLNASRIDQVQQQLVAQRRKSLLDLSDYRAQAAFNIGGQAGRQANIIE